MGAIIATNLGGQISGKIFVCIEISYFELNEFDNLISGAHINPAITVALASIRRFSLLKVPVYLIAQYIGAFLGTAIVWSIYSESIHDLDREVNISNNFTDNLTAPTFTTAGIFITLPAPSITIFPAIADQAVSTGLLTFAILLIGDECAERTPRIIQSISCGLTVLTFVVGFGYNCGAILNPG